MNITDVNKAVKAHKRRRRLGRGESSGYGKTAGRGHKGLGQRSGGKSMMKLEGGQMPIFRTAPKRGFNNDVFRKEYRPINVGQLERIFEAGDTVGPDTIRERGMIKRVDLVKILGNGELTKALTVKAHAISAGAKEKIEKAGGSVEIIAPTRKGRKKNPASAEGATPETNG